MNQSGSKIKELKELNELIEKVSTKNEIDELDELIDLAEKVSVNIDTLSNNIRNSTYFTIAFLFTFIFVGLFWGKFYLESNNNSDYLSPILYFIGVSILASMLYQVNSMASMKKEIKSENLILGDLLNMIHDYKQFAYKDISIVKKAVVNMRLNRISFNKQSSKNKAFSKEENIVSAQKKTITT